MFQTVAAFIVFLAWGSMILGLLAQRNRGAHVIVRRAPVSKLGIVLQGVAFAAVFGIRQRPVAFFAGPWGFDARALSVVADLCALTGAALVIWSQRTLGAQWSVSARLLADHQLITTGPYRYVRHPIYSAMMLLMIAVGLALTMPRVLGAALVVYLLGTLVRIRSEEALMRDAFGSEFERYRQRVPALLPVRLGADARRGRPARYNREHR